MADDAPDPIASGCSTASSDSKALSGPADADTGTPGAGSARAAFLALAEAFFHLFVSALSHAFSTAALLNALGLSNGGT